MKKNLDNIIVTVVNGEQEFLEHIPHRNFLNLSMVYRSVSESEDGFCSIMLSKSAIDSLEISEDELFNIAVENIERDFTPMLEMIDTNFYVLSNEYKVFGAVNMIISDKIKELAERIDRNLFILPSSVHEVFILPDYNQDIEFLKSVVMDANRTVVKGKDILSDNVYYYNRTTKSIDVMI